jgi:hypothetical protein
MATLSIKAGATLQLRLAVTNDDGTAVDLTGVTATSQVRDSYGKLIADLTIILVDSPGVLSITQDTTGWSTGTMRMDLKLVISGVTLISQTVPLLVEEAVTR